MKLSASSRQALLSGFCMLALFVVPLLLAFCGDVIAKRKKSRVLKRHAEDKAREKERVDYIRQNSSLLRQVTALNAAYGNSFSENLLAQYIFDYAVSSAKQWGSFDVDAFAVRMLSTDRPKYESALAKSRGNRSVYPAYASRLEALIAKRAMPSSIPEGLFTSKEDYLIEEERIARAEAKNPVLSINLLIRLRWCGANGRLKAAEQFDYSERDIERLLSKVDDAEDRKAAAQYERSQMTPSLRYDVMKRDGFRCQLCGRSASDGVTLEVDHIIPVSKGGKTVMSNLQTLCWDCNRGKSNKL